MPTVAKVSDIESEFGCVSVLGVTGLKLESPRAPKQPAD